MKIAYRLLFVLLVSMFLSACGDKTAGIDGKVVDGKGKPLSGISIIFKQVQPTQGYEQFETKTGADGSFHLTGVAPLSDYIMTPLSDKWKTKVTRKIKTLEAGQKLVLSDPIKIRFQQMKDGTVSDTKTGLQWLIHPAADITAGNVISVVKGLNDAGFADWRLPTRAELESLALGAPAAKLPTGDVVPVNKTCCAWIAENNGNVDWKFYVEEDIELWSSNKDTPDNRIVIVRNFTPIPAIPTPVAAKPADAKEASTAPAPLPLSAAPAVKEPAVTVTTETPAAQPATGVRQASRKACADKKASAAKEAQPAPAPPATAPSVATAPAAKTDTPKKSEPAKVTAVTPKAIPTKVSEPAKSSDTLTINFDLKKTTLSPSELVKLKSFYAKIKGAKGTVAIDGHADEGSARNSAVNLRLSLDRAYNVAASLKAMGLSDKNIKFELRGLGDGKPVAPNDTLEGRNKNRRAEINFLPE